LTKNILWVGFGILPVPLVKEGKGWLASLASKATLGRLLSRALKDNPPRICKARHVR